MLLNTQLTPQDQLLFGSVNPPGNPTLDPTSTYGNLGSQPSNNGVGSAPTLVTGQLTTTVIDTSLFNTSLTTALFTDDTIATAQSIGSLNGTVTRSGSVGSTDLVDFYSFNVGGSGIPFNLTLTGMSADADVDVIRDFNGNGIVDTGDVLYSSTRSGTNDESINVAALSAGTGQYFVRVRQYSGDTSYTLNLSNSNPNNLLAVERNAGTLTSHADFSGTINASNTSDLIRFNLSSTRDVTFAMTGLGSDADLRLIYDANNNGIIDSGDSLASSTRTGSANEVINRILGAGNYFAQVYRYGSNDTNYSLRLVSTAPQVNVTVNQVNAIDNPDSGWFGDNADYYSKITIGSSTYTSGVVSNDNTISPNWTFGQMVTGSTTTIALQLWDSDGGFAGADDHIDIDASNGLRDLNLTYNLLTNQVSGDVSGFGNSMMTVNGAGDSDRAQIKFTVHEGDWYDNNLGDYYLTHLTRAFAADGSLSRNDMITLLREAQDGGTIDATELTDLRRIQTSLSYLMPEYVSNLNNKIVNSDPANSRSGIGNLFAGSSSTQMESLIGKWFLGSDRPDAKGTYRYTQGSLFQGGVALSDIKQGDTGDCYFLASLGAAVQDKPGVINNMFIDNGDGTFTVRFFKPDGSRDYVTVDRYLPTDAWGNAIYAGWNGGSYNETNNELWVALLEKAYAQLNESGWIGQNNTNSYTGIDGGWMAPVMNQISGLNTNSQSVGSMSKTDLINLVNSGKMLTAGFVSGGGFGVVNSHAYTLTAYNATTGLFHLHNPWGNTHADVTWSQLLSLNARIEWTLI